MYSEVCKSYVRIQWSEDKSSCKAGLKGVRGRKREGIKGLGLINPFPAYFDNQGSRVFFHYAGMC